jgi:hypothetical protein
LPALNNTIHFIPQDTGVYIISFVSDGKISCKTSEFKDNIDLLLSSDFDALDRNTYLLNNYPVTLTGKESARIKDGLNYYVFYVK